MPQTFLLTLADFPGEAATFLSLGNGLKAVSMTLHLCLQQRPRRFFTEEPKKTFRLLYKFCFLFYPAGLLHRLNFRIILKKTTEGKKAKSQAYPSPPHLYNGLLQFSLFFYTYVRMYEACFSNARIFIQQVLSVLLEK